MPSPGSPHERAPLGADERELVGGWVADARGPVADSTARRIEWLTSAVLEKVADSPDHGAWETLYRDPADGRLWERTYPQGELHGGGPPRLTEVGEAALARYRSAP